jgi:hypothetical protein
MLLLSKRLHFLGAVLNKPMLGLYLHFVRLLLTFRWRRLCVVLKCCETKFTNFREILCRKMKGLRFFSTKTKTNLSLN